jgi:hypothetical protein
MQGVAPSTAPAQKAVPPWRTIQIQTVDGLGADRLVRRWRCPEWERDQQTSCALDADPEWQKHVCAELGPDSEQITRCALALVEARACPSEIHRAHAAASTRRCMAAATIALIS